MLYFVDERFRNGDPKPAYARFAEKGRMVPDGLEVKNTWITQDLTRCLMIMETEDPALFDLWIEKWADLVDFEITPIRPGGDAAVQVVAKAG